MVAGSSLILDGEEGTDIEVAAPAVWLNRAPSWSPVRQTWVPSDLMAQSCFVATLSNVPFVAMSSLVVEYWRSDQFTRNPLLFLALYVAVDDLFVAVPSEAYREFMAFDRRNVACAELWVRDAVAGCERTRTNGVSQRLLHGREFIRESFRTGNSSRSGLGVLAWRHRHGRLIDRWMLSHQKRITRERLGTRNRSKSLLLRMLMPGNPARATHGF